MRNCNVGIKIAVMAKDRLPPLRQEPRGLADVLKQFDEWVKMSGAIDTGSSWYYEVQSLLENAFEAGSGQTPEI